MSIRNLILEHINGAEMTGRDELVALIQDIVPVPPKDELERRYIASFVARTVATFKDKQGRRIILARRSPEDTQYINIETCKSKKILDEIRKRLKNEINGRNDTLDKVNFQIVAIQTQLFPEQITRTWKKISAKGE